MRTTRFGIVGGGLAGTLLAHYLGERDLVIVDEGRGCGGSSAPSAIFHPFPGRSFLSTPDLESALKVALPLYLQWAEKWPEWVQERTMLRPLVGKAGERLRKSLGAEKERCIAGVRVRRYLPEEALPLFPDLQHVGEVIAYDSCFSVALHALMSHLAKNQEASGLRQHAEVQSISREGEAWVLKGAEWEGCCHTLILAAGSRLQEWLPTLQGEVEGGHLLTMHSQRTDWMASRGDVHWCPTDTGGVAGATRWKVGEEPIASDEAMDTLASRVQSLLNFPVRNGELWEGERLVSVGERLPYAGAIPGLSHGFLLGGLGSKGLLFGPWSARSLADHLLSSTPIPVALQPRFSGEATTHFPS